MFIALKQSLAYKKQSYPHFRDEFAQTLIRFSIYILFVSILYFFFYSHSSSEDIKIANDLSLALFGYTFLLFLWLWFVPSASHIRIIAGIIGDATIMSVAMSLFGDWTQMFFWVYLLIIIGNGYRYGHKYVIFSAVICFAGVGLAWMFSPDWSYSLRHTVGGLAILAISPIHVYLALRRLNHSVIREKQANSIKSQFLANMSHEIRTPMNGILGMLEVTLTRKDLHSEAHKDLMVAKDSAESLLTLLNDILDISKLEAEKIVLEDKDFSLEAFLKDIQLLLAPTTTEKGLSLSISLAPHAITWVRGDHFRLRQVMLNIISNAVKFTERGSITVRLDAQQQEERIRLFCTISDTGIGISPEAQQHIFGLFNQASSSTSRNYGGTGLGLAITKLIVERMGGEISVDSEQGKGSTFSFSVYVKPAQKPFATPEPETPVLATDKLQDCHIMLVEDNLINQHVAKKMLAGLGAQTDVCNHGLEVVDYFTTHPDHPYNLVLMDCQMPEMDGYDATEALLALWKTQQRPAIPIIALTAQALPEDQARCLAVGMSDYIPKPIQKESLYSVLNHWLRCNTPPA